MYRILSAALVAAALAISTTAHAKKITCTFDSWSSKKKETAPRWLGKGFRVDTNRNTVKILGGGQYHYTLPIDKINERKSKTTYTVFKISKDENNTYKDRYSFSVSSKNVGRVTLSSPGFELLRASGTCK